MKPVAYDGCRLFCWLLQLFRYYISHAEEVELLTVQQRREIGKTVLQRWAYRNYGGRVALASVNLYYSEGKKRCTGKHG